MKEDAIASFKDALGDLRADLSSLKDDAAVLEQSPEEAGEPSGDVMDLKRRMAKSEEEMQALTDAMKSTLLDVRTMMQDIDNPFNMLRSMGVDKLVNNAVETVENEVIKQKQEERKKKMAESDDLPEKIIAMPGAPMGGQVMPVPVPSVAAPSVPMQQPVASPTPVTAVPGAPAPVSGNQPVTRTEVVATNPQDRAHRPQQIENNDEILSRVTETENTIEILSKEVLKLTKGIDKILGSSKPEKQKPKPHHVDTRTFRDTSGQSSYYDTYVSLIAEYLTIKFGEEGASQLLLEGLYKGWASPKVVKDVRDNLPPDSQKWDISDRGIGYKVGSKTNVEDKILFTSLLGSLDKPINEWKEMTQVFLLLALVKSAKAADSLLGDDRDVL